MEVQEYTGFGVTTSGLKEQTGSRSTETGLPATKKVQKLQEQVWVLHGQIWELPVQVWGRQLDRSICQQIYMSIDLQSYFSLVTAVTE